MGFGFGSGLGSLGWGISMIFSMLLPFVFLVGAIYIALNLGDRGRKLKSGVISEPSPFEILKQRYAKGDINKDEYNQLKAELSKE